MELGIKFLRRPENLKKIQSLEKNFHKKEVQEKIEEFFQKKNQKWEGRTLKDFFEKVKKNELSQFSALRELLKIYKENNLEIESEEISLPLEYVSIMALEDETKNNEKDLYKKYEAFYNSLDLEDRKFFSKKSEISILRQSPDSKKQSVIEAVANAIDALSNEKIGEKGLGIKQALAYILDGGEIEVISKKENSDILELKVQNGNDGNFYEKIKKIHLEEFNESGTEIVIKPEKKLEQDEINAIIGIVKKKFALTLNTKLYINGELLNGYEKITDHNGENIYREDNQNRVDLEINENQILVRDNGIGMDQEVLSKMFLERQGNKKMEAVEEEKVSVYFVEDGKKGINISRKKEVLEAIDFASLDKRKNNLSQKNILIDANFLRVPEARQSIFINKDFFEALKGAGDDVLNGDLAFNEKIKFLNSLNSYLTLFLEEKTSDEGGRPSDIKEFVKKTKTHFKEKVKNILENIEDEKILIPNDVEFQKILDTDKNEENNFLILDKDLFDFKADEISGIEKSKYFESNQIYTVDSEKDFEVLEYGGKYFLNKKLLDLYEEIKDDELRGEALKELLELAVNEVQTSYDSWEERRNKIVEKIEKKKEVEKKLESKEIIDDEKIKEFLGPKFEKVGELDFSDVIPKTKIIDGKECFSDIALVKQYRDRYEIEIDWYFDKDNNKNEYKDTQKIFLNKKMEMVDGQESSNLTLEKWNIDDGGDGIRVNSGTDNEISFPSGTEILFSNERYLILLQESINTLIKIDSGDGSIESVNLLEEVKKFANINNIALDINDLNVLYDEDVEVNNKGLIVIRSAAKYRDIILNQDLEVIFLGDSEDEDGVENKISFNSEGKILMPNKDSYKVGILDFGYDQEKIERIKEIGLLEEIEKIEEVIKYFVEDNDWESRRERGDISRIKLKLRNRMKSKLNKTENNNFELKDIIKNDLESIKLILEKQKGLDKSEYFTTFWIFKTDILAELILDYDFKDKNLEFNDELFKFSLIFNSYDSLSLTKEEKENLIRKISEIDFETDNEKYFVYTVLNKYLNNFLCLPEELNIVLDKISKLKDVGLFKKFQDVMEKDVVVFNKDNFKEEVTTFILLGNKNYKDRNNVPGLAFLKYLESDVNLDLRKAENNIPESAENVFGKNISPAELYYWGQKGNISDEAINSKLGTKEIPERISNHLENQIKKEILGQSAEKKVYIRELLQNMIDTSKRQGSDRIDIEMYQEIDEENQKNYFVDSYRDYGEGIPSLVTLLVAQINQKDGKTDSGFFGSGFLSVFEESDKVEIKTSTKDGKIKYLNIEVKKDAEGIVEGIEILDYKIGENDEEFQGSEVKVKTELKGDKIGEIEALMVEDYLLKNTGVLNAHLDDGRKIDIYLNGNKQERIVKTLEEKEIKVGNEKYRVEINEGYFSQVSSGEGLRMSDLSQKYTELVPKEIKNIVSEFGLSMILDKKIPLIKDRSMIAGEDKYLEKIQSAFAVSVIKKATQALLQNNRKFEGFPDDYFRNINYGESYSGQEGQRILEIANKINSNQEVLREDFEFLSKESGKQNSTLARLAMLIEVDYKKENGDVVKISPAALRVAKLAEATENERIKNRFYEESLKLGLSDDSLKNASSIEKDTNAEAGINQFEEYKRNVLLEELNNEEIEIFNFIKNEIEMVAPEIKLSVIESKFSGGDYNSYTQELRLNRNKLNKQNISKLIETTAHELAHYFEGSDGRHVGQFTHQVKGPFDEAYKKAVKLMLENWRKRFQKKKK